MSTFKLTSEEKVTLEQMHRSTKDRKKADRIKTVLFLNRGFSYVETSELLMLDRDTIPKWIWFSEESSKWSLFFL